ncbi:hypothetical protein [Thermosipho globiformans]|uniref:hypothetical protein n=1 Tax=Thermosipho globiformans TaxID=380685 RepID=UPI000F8EE686|nr:hypothetical protein [Thermosipho globiformans]
MKKIFLWLFFVLPLFLFSEVVLIYPNYGVLVKQIKNGEVIPSNWEILGVESSWYVKTYEYVEKVKLVEDEDFVLKDCELRDGIFISKDGKKYKFINDRLFEIIQENNEIRRIFIDSSPSTATFTIDGGFQFFYILKENEMYQFLKLYADIDEGFVIVVSEPESSYYTTSTRAMLYEKEVYNVQGKKIFTLGNMKDLKKRKTILMDKFSVERKDYNFVSINGFNSVDWQPCQRVVYVKSPKQIPSGQVQIWSSLSGKEVPIDSTIIKDVDEETEIFLGPSWENWYKWSVDSSVAFANRRKITATLYLKGRGEYKIRINGRNINNLKTNAKIVEKKQDYVILLSHNTQTIHIEYDEDRD